MIDFQRVISSQSERRQVVEFYNDDVLLGNCDIHPFNLYKDQRLNFRDELVPDTIDIKFHGNVCSADLIGENIVHDAFFNTIYEYMRLPHFKMFLLNIKEPLLYDFYLQNFPIYKQKIADTYPEALASSWLEHDQTKSLIASWNVDFEFQATEASKMMCVYRNSTFHNYQNSSWIKRRTELSNGKYV